MGWGKVAKRESPAVHSLAVDFALSLTYCSKHHVPPCCAAAIFSIAFSSLLSFLYSPYTCIIIDPLSTLTTINSSLTKDHIQPSSSLQIHQVRTRRPAFHLGLLTYLPRVSPQCLPLSMRNKPTSRPRMSALQSNKLKTTLQSRPHTTNNILIKEAPLQISKTVDSLRTRNRTHLEQTTKTSFSSLNQPTTPSTQATSSPTPILPQ